MKLVRLVLVAGFLAAASACDGATPTSSAPRALPSTDRLASMDTTTSSDSTTTRSGNTMGSGH